jgi:hypothetical protein
MTPTEQLQGRIAARPIRKADAQDMIEDLTKSLAYHLETRHFAKRDGRHTAEQIARMDGEISGLRLGLQAMASTMGISYRNIDTVAVEISDEGIRLRNAVAKESRLYR